MTAFLSLAASSFAPGAGFTAFLALTGLVAVVCSAIIAIVATVYGILNRAYPERRIQKHRDNDHVRAEMLRAPGSVAVISLAFAGGLFIQGQGWALTPLPITWWSVPLMTIASVIAYDTWFYWVHRLLHWKPMYRFHALHHTSVAPTIWTHHYETFVEASLNQLFYIVIVFVLPVPWPALVLHRIYDQASGMVGHSGFEHFAGSTNRTPWPLASTIFHDQHHGYFRFNFAHSFSLWDRVMGTLHPRYDRTVEEFEGIIAGGADKAPTTADR
jgi:sterol desaturase/sphingolipid hydroxylase (fatty acid hydroxylase superfamily)